MRPRLLDLFCCAGGAGMGYSLAGFDVVGVDIKPQPNYPFAFHQADALALPAEVYNDYDAIHASPPCQAFTKAQKLHGNTHPDLIESTRAILKASGLPYIIENVVGAPLVNPTLLMGTMFGLRTERPRLFETSFQLPLILDSQRTKPQAKMGRPVKDDEFMQIVGHFSNVALAREIMGTPWMNQHEMAQAIPPAYTEFIGTELLKILERAA